jgi:hypothetical protein
MRLLLHSHTRSLWNAGPANDFSTRDGPVGLSTTSLKEAQMKRMLLASFALVALAAAPAMAQSGAAGAGGSSGNGAGQTPQGAALNNGAAPGSDATTDSGARANMTAPGGMSEFQARAMIEASGFTSVSGLALSPDGAWHGRAMRGGSSINVGIDPQGNVIATTPPY